MNERYWAVIIAIALALWVLISVFDLDVRWLGIAIDGGLLRPERR
jgi:hypothetical protein